LLRFSVALGSACCAKLGAAVKTAKASVAMESADLIGNFLFMS
jgi:hypothetical protein